MTKEERVEWALYHADDAGRRDSVASILAAEVYRLREQLAEAHAHADAMHGALAHVAEKVEARAPCARPLQSHAFMPYANRGEPPRYERCSVCGVLAKDHGVGFDTSTEPSP